MKKLTVAVGLAIVSAASVKAQMNTGSVAGQLTPLETSKPWSLSATVRGFYDDNYLTLPKSYPVFNGAGGYVLAHPIGSWGTEVSPAASFNHTAENTVVAASYLYDLQWYANQDTTYQTHEFNGSLQHEFSDRYKLTLADSFVVAQEPNVIDSGVVSTPLRISGNNVRNTGQLDFYASLTKLLDLHLGYGNTVYAYQQVDRSVIGYPFTGTFSSYPAVPSYSDLLDRMQQLGTVDLRWKATPDTTAILGYQYGHTDYTSPGYIIYPHGPGTPYNAPLSPVPGVPAAGNTAGYHSSIRNSDSDFGFVGLDESITPTLSASVRVGAEYLDYYNFGTSRVSPYADASITYVYNPGDSAQLGVKHIHNSTDVVGVQGTTPVLDEETTAIYASDTHRITERLSFTAMGQIQLSSFDGGGTAFNGKMDQFIILQANFTYQFNPWLMAEAGYNYSKLNSDLLYRAYTRDVMYLGFRAVY